MLIRHTRLGVGQVLVSSRALYSEC